MSGVARRLMSAAGREAGPEGAWDLSYAYYDPPEGLAWNLATAGYSGKSFSVAGQESSPTGVFFKPDGLKMYVVGNIGDAVYEYDLSTAWDVSSATFLQSFSVAAQETAPHGLFFKPDGTKMYIVGTIEDGIDEYDLSTAWNILTAVHLQFKSVAAQDTGPQGFFFKPDGTKMYVTGSTGDAVYEYDLSTAWDVSTAVFLQNFSVAAQDTIPQEVFFKPDGLKMYIVGSTGDAVYEYNLSTAWDVSSATFLQSFSVAAQETGPFGFFFKPDGSKMYVVGRDGDAVNQYTLGGFSVAAQETTPTDLFFKPDGTKMYVVGAAGDDVNEYDLSTAWDVSTATFLQLFSVAAQEDQLNGLFFKPDGLKMYVIGANGDAVNEYDLSTAWDISTANFLQLLRVAEASPQGVFFRDDGIKMYVVGTTGDAVYEYDLSTAWDVSTASFLQSFIVNAQDASPQGLFFKPDGIKMYIIGSQGDDVNEYDLSTAWDVSTATFLQLFSVAAQDTVPNGLFFKPDGLKMYVVGAISDRVYTYTLGVQE